MIYLRSVLEDNGNTVDLLWYCSQTCYRCSLANDPVTDNLEEGGAYPCGAESDSPDFCATCGEPVGNPLTEVGKDWVREFVTDTLTHSGEESLEDMPNEQVARARSLLGEYSYLFPPYPELA